MVYNWQKPGRRSANPHGEALFKRTNRTLPQDGFRLHAGPPRVFYLSLIDFSEEFPVPAFNDYAHKTIETSFAQHEALLSRCLQELSPLIIDAGRAIRSTLKQGGKVMFCGNGGSAADSQHIAAEFVGHFMKERGPLNAIALTTDTSILTAVGNDYSFNDVFSRQVRGISKPGDILVGITTSGNSQNVIEAVQAAKKCGCKTIGLLGRDGGKLAPLCDISFVVPSNETPRIQEMHILIGHILCDLLEEECED
jgi:D-sedoheptulose 7-phosphate isomerase